MSIFAIQRVELSLVLVLATLTAIDANAQAAATSETQSLALPAKPERPPTESARKEAKALYAQGVVAFKSGKFQRSAELFAKAYSLTGKAELLYDLGVSYEAAKQAAIACECYRRFLSETALDNPKRPDASARLERIGPAVPAPALPPPPPPPIVEIPPPPPAATVPEPEHVKVVEATSVEKHHEESHGSRMPAYVTGGVAIVALGLGAYFGAEASAETNTLNGEVVQGSYPASQMSTIRAQKAWQSQSGVAADILLIGGGVAGAAAVVLFVLRPGGSNITVAAGPTGVQGRIAF
jgi:tetratricopeptide (TPR) repeat protein